MEKIAIEDEFHDILGKAMTGLRISERELSEKSGVDLDTIRALVRGRLDETSLPRVAPVLGLDGNALLRIALGTWYPRPVELDGLAIFNTPYYGDMRVNAFLVWDPASRDAAIFDTGTDAFPILDKLEDLNLNAVGLFLTHTHPDHIAEAHAILSRLDIPCWSNEAEPFENSKTFSEGQEFQVGGLTLSTRTTSGHSKGGTTWVIDGLGKPVAIVGDAMFAGSMGGGKVSYQDALEKNRQKILTLPDDTVLCPGHGPMTTVREEKRNNPFFPEFKTS